MKKYLLSLVHRRSPVKDPLTALTYLGLLALIPMIVSCATALPKPTTAQALPKPTTAQDALLIVVMERKVDIRLDMEGIYFDIEIKNEKALSLDSKPLKQMHTFTHLPAGSHEAVGLWAFWSVWSGNQFTGVGSAGNTEKAEPINVSFTLPENGIAFFPEKLVYIVDKDADNRIIIGWNLEKLTDEEKRTFLDELKTKENFSLWKNEFNLK